jgi:AraC family transcriptional regulator, transcriptional activator of the genes for pyochelin and ferripyochelin receptors
MKVNLSASDWDAVYKAKLIIETKYIDRILVADLASQVNTYERKLEKGFRHLFGMTVHQYILQKRIDVAMDYLRADRYNIKETAYACGFNDISVFNRAFKKITGESPSEWRRTNVLRQG